MRPSRPSWTLRPSRPPPAGDRGRSRALRALRRADSGRSRARHDIGACGRPPHTVSPATARTAAALLERLLAEVPSGVERSDLLFELGSTLQGGSSRRASRCTTRRSARPATTTPVVHGSWPAAASTHLLAADVPAALADARAALDRAERVGDAVADRRRNRTARTCRDVRGRDHTGLLERGVEIEERLSLQLVYYESPRFFFARRLVASARSTGPARSGGGRSRRRGAGRRGDQGDGLWYLAMVEWFAGRLQSALEHANGGIRARRADPVRSRARPWWRGSGLDSGRPRAGRRGAGTVEEGLAFARASANEIVRHLDPRLHSAASSWRSET